MIYTITFSDNENGRVDMHCSFAKKTKLDADMTPAEKVARIALAVFMQIDKRGRMIVGEAQNERN